MQEAEWDVVEISIGSRWASPARDGCESSGQKGREINSRRVHVLGKGTQGPCETSCCLVPGIETIFFYSFALVWVQQGLVLS